MIYRIVFTPEARDELDRLHGFITGVAGADVASRYVDRIIDHVSTLGEFPQRGTPRDDLRAGLRTLAWRRRVTVAFVVDKSEVVVIGIFYGGRDFEALLAED